MPKRPASRGQPRRKRGRRRYIVPEAAASFARPRPDPTNVVPFPVHPRSEAPPAPPQVRLREHHQVTKEIVRIAVISVAILILLVILTFIL